MGKYDVLIIVFIDFNSDIRKRSEVFIYLSVILFGFFFFYKDYFLKILFIKSRLLLFFLFLLIKGIYNILNIMG